MRNGAYAIMKRPALSCYCHCLVDAIWEGEKDGHGARRVIGVVCVANQAGIARLMLARMCNALGKVGECSGLRNRIVLSV